MPSDLDAYLASGLQTIGLTLTPLQQHQLVRFIELMMKWNKAYNLSAIRDPIEAVDKHLLDSLSLLPMLESYCAILDIGAGAGLPGIPLAIARPDCKITLVDSNGKKTRFMSHCAQQLGLTNVSVIHSRIEQLPDDIDFELVTARALATIAQMLAWLHPLMTPGRKLLAMKGQFPQQELSEIPNGYTVLRVDKLPSLRNADARHAVFIQAASH